MIEGLDKISYSDALQEAVKIHISRREKYGDSWRERKEYQLMGLVKEKADRLEYNFLHPTVGGYDNKKDCLIDLINWALFYLQVELEKEPKKVEEEIETIPF